MSAAISQERALEVIANNLANLNTTGFKEDRVTFTVLDAEPSKNYKSPIPPAKFKVNLEEVMPLKGNDLGYVGIAGMTRDNSQGPALVTHNPHDLMLEGPGLFAIQTKQGTRYSRAGNFTKSPDGALVTKFGDPVLGEKGVIYLKSGEFQVNRQGEVFQNGKMLDRLAIFDFEKDSSLERRGNNYLFFGGDPATIQRVKAPSVQQGFLEGSNVNAVKNLTAMIIAHRSYEAYQKAVSNYDQIMEKSSNRLAEVRA